MPHPIEIDSAPKRRRKTRARTELRDQQPVWLLLVPICRPLDRYNSARSRRRSRVGRSTTHPDSRKKQADGVTPAGLFLYQRMNVSLRRAASRSRGLERQGIAGKQKRAASQALKTRPIAAIIFGGRLDAPARRERSKCAPRGGNGVVSSTSDQWR